MSTIFIFPNKNEVQKQIFFVRICVPFLSAKQLEKIATILCQNQCTFTAVVADTYGNFEECFVLCESRNEAVIASNVLKAQQIQADYYEDGYMDAGLIEALLELDVPIAFVSSTDGLINIMQYYLEKDSPEVLEYNTMDENTKLILAQRNLERIFYEETK